MADFIEPSFYELSDFHGNLRVTFSPHCGPFPGSDRNHRVTYHDKTMSKEFLGSAVQVVQTGVGRFVTVTIRQSLDAGSVSFSVLIPRVNLLAEGSPRVQIETEGITTTHRSSPVPALNRGQRDVYSVTPLIGTASIAITPYPIDERVPAPVSEPPRRPSVFSRPK